jgi:hypothetical protein
MYNFRYHLASLVAVFLALSIGLLLGTIVVERGILDDQRDAIVEGLQEEFGVLAEENSTLSEENQQQDAFMSDTLPSLISGRLAEKTVVVMTNTGRTDGLGATTDAVTQAGGRVVTVTLNEENMGLNSPDVVETVEAVMGERAPEDLEESVVASLVAEWASPQAARPVTDALVDAGALSSSEFPLDTKADGVVVMVSWSGTPDEVALDIAQALNDSESTAVGVESATNPDDVAVAAAERGLSAVDDVGRIEGQFSVVLVLEGTASGFYGFGDNAQAAYPLPEVETVPAGEPAEQ